MSFALAMLMALAIDWVIGWPDALTRRIGHPVIWIGALISRLEAAWNAGPPARRRQRGRATLAITLGATVIAAAVLQSLLPANLWGTILLAIFAWPFVAANSLRTHVAAIADPLVQGDIDGARTAVSRIVGRDPEALDQGGIARAAIESLAENTSDGITAPLFWGAIFGLPGIAGYKAVNTLDSMIGYYSPRYRDFGRASARLDDLVNWIPARITGVIYCIVATDRTRAWAVMSQDAARHRSPNAGWPEAAMAGALNVRLSGPRSYHDGVSGDPWLNGGATSPDGAAIQMALGLFERTLVAIAVLLALLVAV